MSSYKKNKLQNSSMGMNKSPKKSFAVSEYNQVIYLDLVAVPKNSVACFEFRFFMDYFYSFNLNNPIK